MGINDRDYYRQVNRGSFFASGMTNVWQKIIIANVIVFALQLFSGEPGAAVRGGRARDQLNITRLPQPWIRRRWYFGGQIWRLVTYAFCHDTQGIWHILFNMLGVWIFGRAIEALYGSREFLAFYLTAAVVAGVANVALMFSLGTPQIGAVGASGAVMALAMVYALYYPTHEFILYIFPIQARWLVTFYVIMDLLPVLQSLGGQGNPNEVAHAAHLGGLAYGFLYKMLDLRYGRLLSGWNVPRFFRDLYRRRKVKLYQPAEPAESIQKLHERVDEILVKISDRGEASLTDREREILKEASRRFKEK